ncbi:MAG: hypothetical protein PVI60_08235 [Desulfobacteraceae bacterium]
MAGPDDDVGAVAKYAAVIQTKARVLQAADQAAATFQIPSLPVLALAVPLNNIGPVGHIRVGDIHAQTGRVILEVNELSVFSRIGGQHVGCTELGIFGRPELVQAGDKATITHGQVCGTVVIIVQQRSHHQIVTAVAGEVIPTYNRRGYKGAVGIFRLFIVFGEAEGMGGYAI